jgi:hypothetical protein
MLGTPAYNAKLRRKPTTSTKTRVYLYLITQDNPRLPQLYHIKNQKNKQQSKHYPQGATNLKAGYIANAALAEIRLIISSAMGFSFGCRRGRQVLVRASAFCRQAPPATIGPSC